MSAAQVAEPEVETPDPQRWRALAVALTAAFMTLLDVTIVNVALPSIRDGLHATDRELQWILAGYSLMFGLVLVPAGRLGDARGRRRMFITGIAAFTLSSAAAGTATSGTFLLVARLVQGAAGGLLTPQVSGLIQQLFRGPERGRAFGFLGAVVSLSTAVGPLVGGVLIAVFGATEGWRWIFYVNLPIGATAIALSFRTIPGTLGKHARESLDPIGVVLLGGGVALVLLPLIENAHWWLCAVAVAVFAAFVSWERWYGRRRTPLVALELFRSTPYTVGVLVALLYFSAFTPLFFLFALYLQTGLHDDPLQTGLGVVPFALGSAASAVIGGRLVARFGRLIVVAGLTTVLVGLGLSMLAVTEFPAGAAHWATIGPWFLAGIGSGFVVAPNQTLTLSDVPVNRAGSAGGVVQTAQRVGAAFGLAVITAAFFGHDSGRSTSSAYDHAAAFCMLFVLIALTVAVTDVLAHRRVPATGAPPIILEPPLP
ncbi:MAG TPA: MFS transporter [Micromonosporaceae bacterium]|jgi:EmrB/QacA subfamily drug resistance transporter